ncbi:MAG: ImmA/IrrE family metallo-endopeptidase [Nitrospina sp.]|jgi:Zn-dependent peptidase ImmA (M78 family)|nr:ImmA/IrrE family metallo-endopeptidase [Nitrospina sp.]
MAFRRGFKSQCERRAVEVRRDLGLPVISRLDAFNLAAYLRITVWSTKEITTLSPEDQKNLISKDRDSWSALTLQMGIHDLIIYKAEQSDQRTNSVVMHELSHIILGHELADVCISDNGSFAPSNFSQEQEEEANWLGGTLLLPRPLLLHIFRKKLSRQEITKEYGVSHDMLIWRERMTGVGHQLKNLYQK